MPSTSFNSASLPPHFMPLPLPLIPFLHSSIHSIKVPVSIFPFSINHLASYSFHFLPSTLFTSFCIPPSLSSLQTSLLPTLSYWSTSYKTKEDASLLFIIRKRALGYPLFCLCVGEHFVLPRPGKGGRGDGGRKTGKEERKTVKGEGGEHDHYQDEEKGRCFTGKHICRSPHTCSFTLCVLGCVIVACSLRECWRRALW